jgi:hypothetical protein
MFIAIGLVLVIVAAILFWQQKRVLNEIFSIKATDTSTVAHLEDLSRTITSELGSSGAFKDQVEVKGEIRCNNPLTAQLSQRQCVYCHTQVTEKYEETYYETDDDGNRERKVRNGSNTLADNTLRINFHVEDGTGRIQVNPNEAEIQAIEVVDRYELNQGRSTISFGGFTLNVSNQTFGDRRILGYQYNEWVLPLDTRVYVLGEVTDSEGFLMVRKPTEKGQKFLITHKSEEELIKDKQSSAKGFFIGSIVCAVLGVLCVIIGLFAG